MKGVGELVEDQNGIEAMVGFGKSTGRQKATEKITSEVLNGREESTEGRGSMQWMTTSRQWH